MKTKINEYDWEKVQNFYNDCLSQKDTMLKFKISRTVFEKAKDKKLIVCKKYYHKQSEETKKLLSKKMKEIKKRYSQDEEKNFWKRKNKFVSTPCEYFKKYLEKNSVFFYSEYKNYMEWNRNFSIDIAFPNEKIGIEINGNQHYNRDGSLKEYYQKRHDLLKSFGWEIIEIPYLMVYNDEFKKNILLKIKEKVNLKFDYSKFVKEKLEEKRKKIICPICGGKKNSQSKKCYICSSIENGIKNRKVKRPLKEELEKELKESNLSALGRKYGVSSNAIKKWCKNYEINYKKQKKIV